LPVGEPVLATVLVIGCSEEVPNQVRAYHLIASLKNGDAVLSRHDGAAYTGNMRELASYRGSLTTMVGSVLEQMPPDLRYRARAALINRWNRDWGVTSMGKSCAICQGDARW
jgi:hypothetical protein